MLKMLTAYSTEIDDVEAAVAGILGQLDLAGNLLANAAGIVTCYPEFVESGVVAALCKAAPFPVVGCTTLAAAVPGDLGQLILSLSVLTSDDVAFSCGMTDGLQTRTREAMTETYAAARAELPGEPSFMISFAPLLYNVAGDAIIDNLNEVTDGLPNFGTCAVDHNPDYRDSGTICNGVYSRSELSFLLLSGDVEPRFLIASISEDRILKQKAIITKSEGNQLLEVNNMSVLQYLQSIGLATDGSIEGVNSIPFVIDYNDGTKPIARAIFALTDDGHAVCGGTMPEGATLAVGAINYQEVVSTAMQMVDDALATGKRGGLLMFSCIIRNLSLGVDTLAEMEAVREGVGSKMPYQLSYSGGEICPVYNEAGKPVNRFHNDTIVACLF